ncbi:MAG: acyl-CoA synthetase [Alphaproteobacteria bacterium]|nr:acyl-CoA synthetase [Alphaproteobacteria bacterium]
MPARAAKAKPAAKKGKAPTARTKAKPAVKAKAHAKAKAPPKARPAPRRATGNKALKAAASRSRGQRRLNVYETDLGKNAANYEPLTPSVFLERAALVYPEKTAVIHGKRSVSYRTFFARCRQLASSLVRMGIKEGDTVAILAPNTPEMLEAHYGVPMSGAVLNAINYRLSAGEIGFILDHGEAKVLLVDREFAGLAKDALARAKVKPKVIDIDDPEYDGAGEPIGGLSYEDFLAGGDPDFAWIKPRDEWQAIALNYTSGTTGNPKGVVYHHRGAYLLALGNLISASIRQHPVYLWSLPMFHCNGWCFTWSISVVAGTHVCLRRVNAQTMFEACEKYGVTHMCGAPIVMSMLVNASDKERKALTQQVEFMTAAAPPPAATLARMEAAGFAVHHVYGLTETYGPAVVNAWHSEWDAHDPETRARIKARQGVRYPVLEDLAVKDPETMQDVPRDGETMGEVFFRGNVVMKGYLKNPKATKEAFAGGWFHSGDLGVWHKDGYIQLKDRSKDIIISGGENISSIEVEDVLMKHPAVNLAAVVGRADEKWGEAPVAFIELKPGKADVTEAEIIAHCRANLAHYKAPKNVIFCDLPKTSTGKIQKFRLRELAAQKAA